MAILVFGFEHFLEFDENPAELVARSLEGKKIKDQEVVARILHVDYSSVEREIVSAIEAVKPVLAIGFGLAPSRTKFTPEKIAINYRFSHEPDNKGKTMSGGLIDPNGPEGLFANLPVEALVDHLNSESIPSALSTTAGTYLCNNAMYITVREARKRGFNGGFIHIPCHSEWVAEKNKTYSSLPLATLFRAAEISLDYCLEHTSLPLLIRE